MTDEQMIVYMQGQADTWGQYRPYIKWCSLFDCIFTVKLIKAQLNWNECYVSTSLWIFKVLIQHETVNLCHTLNNFGMKQVKYIKSNVRKHCKTLQLTLREQRHLHPPKHTYLQTHSDVGISEPVSENLRYIMVSRKMYTKYEIPVLPNSLTVYLISVFYI